jgi:hypothetical protein
MAYKNNKSKTVPTDKQARTAYKKKVSKMRIRVKKKK